MIRFLCIQSAMEKLTTNEQRRISLSFIFAVYKLLMSHLQLSDFLQIPISPVCSSHEFPSTNRSSIIIFTFTFFQQKYVNKMLVNQFSWQKVRPCHFFTFPFLFEIKLFLSSFIYSAFHIFLINTRFQWKKNWNLSILHYFTTNNFTLLTM